MNKQSLYWTCAIHISFCILLFQTKAPKSIQNHNKILVTTIQKPKAKLQKRNIIQTKQIVAPKSMIKSKPKIKSRPKVKPKPIRKKPLAKKKITPVSRKKIVKKIKKQQLKAQAQKSSSTNKQKKEFQDTKPFTFSQASIRFLKDTLILPKKGNVKVTITVQINGTITNIDIVEGQQNKENAQYLVSKLKGLMIPGFSCQKKQCINIVFSHSKN